MIDQSTVQELLNREPFHPFRIHMSDGHIYEVVNPAVVVPMLTKLFIALPNDRWKFLSYSHVTRIEGQEVVA